MNTSEYRQLLAELTGLQTAATDLTNVAQRQNRDITSAEAASLEPVLRRMEVINQTLTRQGHLDAAATVTRSIGVGGPDPTAPTMADAGVVRDFDTLTLGRWALQAGADRYEHISGRQASGASILQRVVSYGVAADGTAPVVIDGDLVKFVDSNRYLVNAVRKLPMPASHSPTFKRPRATQLTTVGQQVTEGDVLSSQRLQLTGDTVTKGTYGGVLALSEQEIDWTEPAMLGLAIQDLAEQYAIATESIVCAAVEAQADQSTAVVLSNTPASDVFIQAVADASAVVYSAARKLPDILFAAPDRWAVMTAMTDSTGRPLFPITGGANSGMNVAGANAAGVTTFGGFNIMGLQVVVSPEFSSGVWGVARSSLVEFYEEPKGLLSINVPSTLSIQYAYRGYAAVNCYAQAVAGFETL